MSHGRQDDAPPPAPPTWTRLMRRTYPTDSVLTALLAGWVVMAAYLFLLPDPKELTESVHPSVGHSIIFVALGATAMARLRPISRSGLGKLFAIGVAGGIAVEVAQEFLTSGRESQAGDVVADAAGLALGMGAVAAAHRLSRRPAVVNTGTATVSAAVLLALIATVAIGPRTVQSWLSCRGHDAPADGLLLHIAPDDITIAGDPAGASELRRQLTPLLDADVSQPGYHFDGTDQAGLDHAPSVVCGLRDAGTFTVFARLRDLPPTQDGPARILTISHGTDPATIDLHLAMADDGASVRLRTSSDHLLQSEIPGLVDADGTLELTLTYDGDTLTLQAGPRTVYRTFLDADPSSWRHDQPLTIGNERTGDRGLEGTITDLDLYAGVVANPGGRTTPTR